MKFLNYNIITADICGIKEHPQDYMNKHFKVIHYVPKLITDCWWFCVEDYDYFELPEFLHEMSPYNLNYWKDGCYKNCEFFEKSFDVKTQKRDDRFCCYGGTNCLKEKYNSAEELDKTVPKLYTKRVTCYSKKGEKLLVVDLIDEEVK